MSALKAFLLVRARDCDQNHDAICFWEDLKNKISKIPGIREVQGVFGHYNAVAIAEVATAKELGTLVTKTIISIKEVAEVETLIAGY